MITAVDAQRIAQNLIKGPGAAAETIPTGEYP